MEKPTETITNKIFNYFENNHQGKNWTLFLITLGLVHSAWFVEFFHRVSWWQWALQIPKANFDIGTQNPYFIFLEILFIASSITRILIAIDIFYILANFCLVDDLLKIVWKKRRDEWYEWRANGELFLDPLGLNHLLLEENKPYIDPAMKMQALRLLGGTSDNGTEEFVGDSKDTDEAIKWIQDTSERFEKDNELPYHIIYWIKLEIKECEKAIAKEEAKNLSLTKQ